MLHNRVREWRTKKGLTREETATAAEITRQALGQIESEKVCPSTAVALRLCRIFGCTVEDLFYEDNLTITAEFIPAERQPGHTNVYVTKIGDRWIARTANPAQNFDLYTRSHGTIQERLKSENKALIELSGDMDERAQTVFLSGCDVGLGFLAAHVNNRKELPDCVWFNRTNKQALTELENGQTHMAAIHYNGDINTLYTWIERMSGKVCVFEFAKADTGWIYGPRNHQFFLSHGSLHPGDLRIVNRPVGAGARLILDCLLEKDGIEKDDVKGYKMEVSGHLSVANAISEGFADAGVGHAAAAARFGLSFVPVVNERCVLIIREENLLNRNIKEILNTLCSGSFRQKLADFGPYDTSCSGTGIEVNTR